MTIIQPLTVSAILGALLEEAAQHARATGAPLRVTRWRLTDEERARVVAGDDLFLTLLTFGSPMQPISMTVGPPEWAPGEGGG